MMLNEDLFFSHLMVNVVSHFYSFKVSYEEIGKIKTCVLRLAISHAGLCSCRLKSHSHFLYHFVLRLADSA